MTKVQVATRDQRLSDLLGGGEDGSRHPSKLVQKQREDALMAQKRAKEKQVPCLCTQSWPM